MDTSLRSLFLRLHDPGSPSLNDLIDLQNLLDHECFQAYSSSAQPFKPADYTPDLVKLIALYLSGSLIQVESLESSKYRVAQLRCLVAALALMLFLNIKELHAEPYNRLRLNISDRFSDIANGRRQSQASSTDRGQHVAALYLIRLVAQYFSLFGRSQPRAEALVTPVLGLVLTGASIASGQYNNLQNIFILIDQIIAEIPKPQRKITLPGLQEITRNSISTFRQSTNRDPNNLIEASELLREALETHLDDRPINPANKWDWIRRAFRRIPQMNKGFFVYGLLDCAVQLVLQAGPDALSEGLRQAIERIVFESSDEYLRIKAINFFMEYRETRQSQYSRLGSKAPSCPPAIVPQFVAELDEVYDNLENDGQNPSRREVSTGSSFSGYGMFQTISASSRSSVPHSADSSERDTYQENPLEPIIVPRKITVIQVDLARKKYQSAGISRNSDLVFFYNPKEVAAFRILMPSGSPARATEYYTEHLFKYPSPSPRSKIGSVAISNNWMVISTNQELVVVKLVDQSFPASSTLQLPYDGWEPVGLSIHETGIELKIAVGQRRSSGRFYEGRILIFNVLLEDGRSSSLPEPIEYTLPEKDFPKDVDISSDGMLIVCRTEPRNSIIMWKLSSSQPGSRRPSLIDNKRFQTLETGLCGITSTSIYISRKGYQYLFCTTYASSERSATGGEWPFCSPIVFDPPTVLDGLSHDLEGFKDQARLVIGAVSSKIHVFAVLERSGVISIMGLRAHRHGGIYDGGQKPYKLEHALPKQKSEPPICPSSLKFDTAGTRLLAVSPNGKVIVSDFMEREDNCDSFPPLDDRSSKPGRKK